MRRLLLVEDDLSLGKTLSTYLQEIGYEIDWHKTGEEAILLSLSGNYSLCILDVGLPKVSGFQIAKGIRGFNLMLPILFLTAKSTLNDKIKGFESGADDYLVKPFEMKELELRIQVLCKRFNKLDNRFLGHQIQIGFFTFHVLNRRLEFSGQTVRLSQIDAELLKLLYQHRNNYLATTFITEHLWQSDSAVLAKRLAVYITRLRHYFEIDPSIQIVNLYNQGYTLILDSN